MRLIRTVIIDGQAHQILISDDMEALSEAYASGRAILGVWNKETMEHKSCPAQYLVESVNQVEEELLERVVRRHLKLPWHITDTTRLVIRELTVSDISQIPSELPAEYEVIFRHEDALRAYIKEQYGFCEYGIWALEERFTGILVGIAGIFSGQDLAHSWEDTYLELGYHIFTPYRRQGYAAEACRAILLYANEALGAEEIYAKIDASNEASIKLAESLGFYLIQTDTSEKQHKYLYEVCFPGNPPAED